MGDAPDDTVDGRNGESPERNGWVRGIGVAVGLGTLGPLLSIGLLVVAALATQGIGLPLLAAVVLTLVLGQYVAFGGVALGYLWRRFEDWGRIRSYLGVRWPTIRELGLVVAGYVAILGILVAVSAVIQAFGAETGENQTAQLALDNPFIVPGLILAMFLVVGPCEELLYRGVVQGRLGEVMPAAPAIAVASAIFAFVHVMALTGGVSARLTTVAVLFFPSLVFGAVYEYTGNLVVPTLLHALHNSILLAILYVAATEGIEPEATLPWLFATIPP